MSRIICGYVKLLKRLEKDSKLEAGSVYVELLRTTLRDHVSQVMEYFEQGSVSLEGVVSTRLEGSEVSPIFTGGRSLAIKPMIPLAFTIIDHNDDSYIISPLDPKRSRDGLERNQKILSRVPRRMIRNYMSWYLARGSIYPFALTRLFKILFCDGGVKATQDLLKHIYDSAGEAVANTLRILKVPPRPSIDCDKHRNIYLVVYRCTRAFVSAVMKPDVIKDLCEYGNGLIIDHHVSYMITDDRDAAYYYSALLNYMVYKIIELRLGTFIRDQFGRPLKAIKELGLEWRRRGWQLDVARISAMIHEHVREAVLRDLGLPEHMPLYELVDYGRDEDVKRSLGARATRVLRNMVRLGFGFENIVRIIDGETEPGDLVKVLKRNVVEVSLTK